jgi:HEAT repeat protein
MRTKQHPWMSNPQVVAALEQLGTTQPNEVVALVQAPDDTVALNACWLLGQFRNKQHSRALLQALYSDRPSLWMPSAVSLTLLDSKRPTQHLIALLLDPQRASEQRFAAGYALAFTSCALRDPCVVDVFVAVVRDQQAPPNVRGVVSEGLGNLFSQCFGGQEHQGSTYEETGQLLINLLHDLAPEVRFWAAFALGSLRYRPALSKLERLASSDTAWFGGWWSVGEEASDAIDRIEGREPPERVGLTKEQALQQGLTI